VELVFKNQTFQVTNKSNPNHIQLRTSDVLWYKENLINIGVRKSSKSCEYIAWIDTEIEFLNREWVIDAIQALENDTVVQLFDVARWLGKKSEIIQDYVSYGRCYKENLKVEEFHKKSNLTGVGWCSVGFAWAAKKNTLLQLGGLFDKGIVGSGDYINAMGFLNIFNSDNTVGDSGIFLREILDWQILAQSIIQKKMGYVKGMVYHRWHGAVGNRGFAARNSITASFFFPFEPKDHVFYDDNGLLKYMPQVRNYFNKKAMKYFSSRNEDD
jgi:hypothetical protein